MAVRSLAHILASHEEVGNVVAIGVDTHKASLAACAIDEAGRVAAERSFANSPAGHRAFGRWLEALPLPRRVGIEGSGSFGAALAQGLLAAGEEVREVPAILTHRERRRTGRPGKSDSVDARAIAVELTAMRLARLEALAAEIAANKLRIEGVLAGEHAALTAICGVGPLHRGAPPRGDR